MIFLLLSLKDTQYSDYVINHLSYGTVGELCSTAVSEGLIEEYRKEYIITAKGKKFIEEQNKLLGKKGINKFIANIPDAYCSTIEIDEVYIPDKI